MVDTPAENLRYYNVEGCSVVAPPGNGPACIVIDEADWILSHRTPYQTGGAQTIRCTFRIDMLNVIRQRLKIMFIAAMNRPADIHNGFMPLPQIYLCWAPDRGIILEILKTQLAVYDQEEDVTNENLHQLATRMALMRTLSADDVTRAVEIRVIIIRTQRTERSGNLAYR